MPVRLAIARFILLLPLGALFVQTGVAQKSKFDELLEKERAREEQERKIKEIDDRLKKMAEASLEKGAENGRPDQSGLRRKLSLSEKELPLSERKLISPADEELQKYATFLRQPETGLCKILAYHEEKLGVHDLRTQSVYPQLAGAGTYYSFLKRSHLADEWAQLRLVGRQFQTGYNEMQRNTSANSGGMIQNFTYRSGNSLGFFLVLGEVPLETITPETGGVKALADLQPPTTYREFYQRIKQGNGPTGIHGVVPVLPQTTYLLRSVLYKKADTIIAFQIVREESDDSLHLLWKVISRFPPPDLKGKPQQ